MLLRKLLPIASMIALTATSVGLQAHNDGAPGELVVHPVRDGIYMLEGNGGNIGVLIGEQGTLLIDDQYPQESGKIMAAVKSLADKPVVFLLNTHWHGDHTGGNANFGGDGTIIVAHDKVRQRLLNGGEIAAFKTVIPPASQEALPVITFADAMGMHWDKQTIDIIHAAPAHTDGDAVIYFKEANVVHTGDLYFNGLYPFIDASSGGSVKGMIAGVDAILARIDEKTQVIPGHGPLGNKAGLSEYRDMLSAVVTIIEPLKAAGKSREEVVVAKPTAPFDAVWGKGFLSPDVWVGIVYDTL